MRHHPLAIQVFGFFAVWLMFLIGAACWLAVPAYLLGAWPGWTFIFLAALGAEAVIQAADEYTRSHK